MIVNVIIDTNSRTGMSHKMRRMMKRDTLVASSSAQDLDRYFQAPVIQSRACEAKNLTHVGRRPSRTRDSSLRSEFLNDSALVWQDLHFVQEEAARVIILC